MAASLDLSNAVFSAFVFYATVVIVKMVFMSLTTVYYRQTRRVFANKEDAAAYKKQDLKPILNNEEVERVRRCHLNDLENVVPFVLLGLLYTATSPALAPALWHFRLFALARLLHTLVYLGQVRQPARALCFLVGVGVNVSLALNILRQVPLA